MKRFFAVAALLFLTSCTLDGLGESASSGSANPDAARVFATEKSTSNVLVVTGVWEAARPETNGAITSTARFEFRDSFVVAAARCTRSGAEPVVAGGRATAVVTAELIELKQAISDTRRVGSDGAECEVAAAAIALPVCPALTPPASRTACFELTGTTLDIYGGRTGIQSFLKISD
jgi:hypothetical protein